VAESGIWWNGEDSFPIVARAAQRPEDAPGLAAPLVITGRSLERRIDPVERDRIDNERARSLIAFSLREDDCCIDVGAHQGAVLREMLRCAPRGRHIAYEPIPQLYARLVQEFPGVDVRCAALSNTAGSSPFKYVRSNPGYSGLRERHYPGEEDIETIEVRLDRLDDVLPEGFAPALIKIDVEGAEREVIEGALRTIATHKPLVLFEHGRGGAEHYGTRPEHIFDLLCLEAGLRIFDLEGDGPYDLQRFVDTFESGERWNFVARR
jgi:FkbM family methyltransferase